MNIQVLSNEIINQIAAGEVVERPAHLVKELVENSLDAKADKITIEVSEGGRFIRVQDNGVGIYSYELERALQRHATSKITKTDDLWNLHTFGFRGEALASAAAVSKLALTSVQKNELKASRIESDFGKTSSLKPSSINCGTEIKIENLFENVPARLKFLKTESTEISQIKQVVRALALGHPEAEFKLIANGELQFFYAKRSSLLERAQDVLEKKHLFEASAQTSTFKCRVVFTSPHEVARTSKQIWLFVQNRWVQDRALQAAVMDAFRSLLMHGEYPHAVVWLDCDPSQLDVNIHPTKSQIKFQDSSAAFKVVHSVLRNALEKAPWVPTGLTQKTETSSPNFGEKPQETLKFQDHTFERTQFRQKTFETSRADLQALKIQEQDLQFGELAKSSKSATELKFGFWSSMEVVGQVNLTYILCQKGDRIIYVDQHAAHERVAYESLMASWQQGQFEIQNYLFPLAIDLSEDRVEVLLKNQNIIEKMGIEFEQLGPISIGIKSAPQIIKDGALPIVFEKLAHEFLSQGGSFAIEKLISDLFASMACHSVVRAGQSLSLTEMKELLTAMDQFALSSFCPHGRPVSVEVSFAELERLFGRIN